MTAVTLSPALTGKRVALYVSLALALLTLCAGSLKPATAEADIAANFCPTYQVGTSMWLDPAWTGNYRCDGPDSVSGYHRNRVMVGTFERAGCVDYADVWHNLITSWVCFPKETYLGVLFVRQDGGWYRGVIRNNNLTYAGRFKGVITYDG